MKVRNHYGSVPRGELQQPRGEWWVVEEEPGIAVAGEDSVYSFEDKETAEQVAEILAAQTDSKLTVVQYHRFEYATFQRKTIVEREG